LSCKSECSGCFYLAEATPHEDGDLDLSVAELVWQWQPPPVLPSLGGLGTQRALAKGSENSGHADPLPSRVYHRKKKRRLNLTLAKPPLFTEDARGVPARNMKSYL
jgi:hypothetical protein